MNMLVRGSMLLLIGNPACQKGELEDAHAVLKQEDQVTFEQLDRLEHGTSLLTQSA